MDLPDDIVSQDQLRNMTVGRLGSQPADQPIGPVKTFSDQSGNQLGVVSGTSPVQNGGQTVTSSQPVSPVAKEGEPAVRVSEKKEFPVAERLTTPEVSPELKEVQTISGEEVTLPQPITNEAGEVVLDDAAPKQVTVTLPMTEEEAVGVVKLHLKITEAARWLAERTFMLAKRMGGKFGYKFKNQNLPSFKLNKIIS